MTKHCSNQRQNGNPTSEFDLCERKSSILIESKDLLRAMRQRRRLIRKTLLTGVPVLLLVITTILVVQFLELPDRELVSSHALDSKINETPQLVFEVISDQELLESLAELGQPSAIATVGNEFKLVRQHYVGQ